MRSSVKIAKQLGCKTACEIGVYQGGHALEMIRELGLKKIYLIDPYEVFDEPSSAMGKTDTFPDNEGIARDRLEKYKNQCVWIKSRSDVAIIPQVDFIYIDGSHEYENVKDDLEKYYPLAKKIIGGHDYYWKPGVKKAVDEFCESHKLKMHAQKPDWWIVK